jgi:hypothetical protein
MNLHPARRAFNVSHAIAVFIWCFAFVPPVVAWARDINEPNRWMLWIPVAGWPFAYLFMFILVRTRVMMAAHRAERMILVGLLFIHLFAAIVDIGFELRAVL